jgi:hypothetical protein
VWSAAGRAAPGPAAVQPRHEKLRAEFAHSLRIVRDDGDIPQVGEVEVVEAGQRGRLAEETDDDGAVGNRDARYIGGFSGTRPPGTPAPHCCDPTSKNKRQAWGEQLQLPAQLLGAALACWDPSLRP